MKKKKILIDLSILKHLYCGLGQIALNYGNYFKTHHTGKENYEIYLLLPKKMFGIFGDKVNYIATSVWNKHFPFLMPRFDVWHEIHQLCRYKPAGRKTKVVLTIHDFNFVYEKKGVKLEKYLNRIQNKINRADKITCISNFAKEETRKHASLNNKLIDVIYNGVEQLDSKPAKQPVQVKGGIPFFFSIGQVRQKKNFHVLIPMMKLFPEKMLYIAGDNNSSYGKYIEEKIIEEGVKNVCLLGEISNEERIWLYRNCEAFLFPSLLEGFGLPVIEAMSFGKPVFSSQETSLKEIGGECAYFWEDFEPEAMKKLIDNNLQNFYLSAEPAQKNIEYAHSFSYDKHMKRYLEVYKEL